MLLIIIFFIGLTSLLIEEKLYLYSVEVIILKQVLNSDDFCMFMREINYELDILAGKLHSISINKVLDKMGFPVNYKEIKNY